LARFFPNFIWAVRDFSLSGPRHDRYLEHQLELMEEVRTMMNKYYQTRHCICFPLPVSADKLCCLEQTPNSLLNPDFRKGMAKLHDILEQSTKFKIFQDPGSKVSLQASGPIFLQFVEEYLKKLNSGNYSFLQDSWEMVTDGLCTKAKEEGLRYYNNKMALVKKKMPLSPKEFNEDHIEHLSNAQAKFFQVLLAVAHSPKGKTCDGEFQNLIKERLAIFERDNYDSSENFCQRILTKLDTLEQTDWKSMEEFEQAVNMIRQEYDKTARGPAKLDMLLKWEDRTSQFKRHLASQLKISELEKTTLEEAEKSRRLELELQKQIEKDKQDKEKIQREIQERETSLLAEIEALERSNEGFQTQLENLNQKLQTVNLFQQKKGYESCGIQLCGVPKKTGTHSPCRRRTRNPPCWQHL
jgi:predicted  nucleic acid-binding Zn-ribbon protein